MQSGIAIKSKSPPNPGRSQSKVKIKLKIPTIINGLITALVSFHSNNH